eukprot:5494039-Pyramimonas_sp.AAC.1
MAQCRGHLLHVAPVDAIQKLTLGNALDGGILRLTPTKREFLPGHAQYVPDWLSRRKGGEAPPSRVCQSEGAASIGGGLPTRGQWPRAITPYLWDIDARHNENWP